MKNTISKILSGVIGLALLAGCNLAPAPTSVPTEDPATQQALVNQASTAAAATVVAQITQDALDNPSPTPTETNTPLPTETASPIPPTVAPATSTPLPTATAPLYTLTPTTPPYKCSILEQSPANGANFDKGADFDGNWKIKNTGTTTWDSSAVDLKYISGTKMHQGDDTRDFSSTVAPDGEVRVVLDMLAPKDAGTYNEAFALVQGGSTLCMFYVSINVQ